MCCVGKREGGREIARVRVGGGLALCVYGVMCVSMYVLCVWEDGPDLCTISSSRSPLFSGEGGDLEWVACWWSCVYHHDILLTSVDSSSLPLHLLT